MAGTRGPVGKSDAERRRTNEPVISTQTVDVAALSSAPVEIPVPDENWHPVARKLWDSFPLSASTVLFEPTDWALLFMACEDLSREMKPRKVNLGLDGAGEPIIVEMNLPIPGGKLTAIQKLMSNLLATIGDRRRMAIEINRTEHKTAGETVAPVDQVAAQRRKSMGA